MTTLFIDSGTKMSHKFCRYFKKRVEYLAGLWVENVMVGINRKRNNLLDKRDALV